MALGTRGSVCPPSKSENNDQQRLLVKASIHVVGIVEPQGQKCDFRQAKYLSSCAANSHRHVQELQRDGIHADADWHQDTRDWIMKHSVPNNRYLTEARHPNSRLFGRSNHDDKSRGDKKEPNHDFPAKSRQNMLMASHSFDEILIKKRRASNLYYAPSLARDLPSTASSEDSTIENKSLFVRAKIVLRRSTGAFQGVYVRERGYHVLVLCVCFMWFNVLCACA
jgi:hypothetical protein